MYDHLILGIFAVLALIALGLGYLIWEVQRAAVEAEDKSYAPMRTADMGAVRVVPFRSEARDRIAVQIAAGQSRHIAAEWAAHDPVCAAQSHDDEDSCSCGLYEVKR